ncbi:unnamed protein product, partial [Rotaria sordida]
MSTSDLTATSNTISSGLVGHFTSISSKFYTHEQLAGKH